MTPPGNFDELGQLLAALCDGDLTPAQGARLEQLANQSPQARQYFLHYVYLNAELHWAVGTGELPAAGPCVPESQPAASAPRPRWAARVLLPVVRWASQLTAASLLLTALGAGALLVAAALWIAPWAGQGRGPVAVQSPWAARLARTSAAEWAAPAEWAEGDALPLGTAVELRHGLAEVVFYDGARVLVQGPARLEVETGASARLHAGRLFARVPTEAVGFTVHTPGGSVVDRGTEFGVWVDEVGRSEVHVFTGSVEIVPPSGLAAGGVPRGVRSGQAVRLRSPAADAGLGIEIEEIAADAAAFLREVPSAESLAGSIAAFRAMVGARPDLLHHYTFEGATSEERRRDRRGGLHLVEAVMSGGRAGGSAEFVASPLAPGESVLRPRRGTYAGNTVGAALQSEAVFHPPQAMTVELLVCFAGFGAVREGAVGAALATRSGARDCGFFIVAVDAGEIAHLFDGDEAWGGSEARLLPSEWYYLASTFLADPQTGTTTVNTYLANLTRGETSLQWVVRDEVCQGTPAASRLGIGKGFDRNLAHAYPWPGMIDEVAVYQVVLGRETLERHLEALTSSHR